MKDDMISRELRNYSWKTIVFCAAIFAVVFSIINALFNPGLGIFAAAFLGSWLVVMLYLLVLRRFPNTDRVLLINLPSTFIVLTLGIGMIVVGLVSGRSDTIALGCIPLVIALAILGWEYRKKRT